MKRLFSILIFSLLVICPNTFTQTTLSAGDIMIVGFNSDTPKNFAFVILKDITAGTEIYFTDDGYSIGVGFRTGEGVIKFTASKNYSVFDVIVSPNTTEPLTGEWSNEGGSFNASTSGDQIISFQGSMDSPNFIAAIQFRNNTWDDTASNSNTSALPAGLTDGVNAIAVGNIDDGMYSGGTANDINTLKSKIQDITNSWTLSNTELDLTTIPTPLPVELTSFKANITDANVNLKWNTATEVNNYGFEIQRSAVSDKQSAESWNKIGFVRGNGNSNSPKSYSFVDENVSSGKYYYRLKQTDIDGKFTFSKVVEADISSPDVYSLDQNYPNPFNPVTTIKYEIPKAGKVKIVIFDMLGRVVQTLVNEFKEAGRYNVQFDAGKLASGTYLYKIQAGKFAEVKKMILLK